MVTGNSEGVMGGSQMAKLLKKRMKLNWNFQRGGEFQTKKPSLEGRYGFFSGTTQ